MADARRKSSARPISGENLQEVFETFCAFGGGANAKAEMDNARFAKFCKDSKLVDKKFTSTDCDLIFSKIKAKGERKIPFATFKTKAIPEIAAKKGMTADELEARILGAGGPTSSGTKADAVKFHDDKDQYTGVYKAGGPTNVDVGTSDLSNITNRKDADVRGVQK
eukprot:TRINITY_DN1034_c0_g3_i1.p1 TRINITY_DN1034_c0_g3~~TRINITY_DN1034_c0_g3_i1.p1  ORF type:complete len:185 (+),score=79.84 TRINITY_DN1034_c0_g3_i1:59-556(+)